MKYQMTLNVKRLGAVAVVCVVIALGVFSILDASFPFPVKGLHPPAATIVQDENGAPLRFFLPKDERWRFPVKLDEVAPVMVRTLTASEDRFFKWHPGVNPLAILRATLQNTVSGRIISGGSTIPMQLARLAQPRDRTFSAKCIEAFRALQLTKAHEKQELLELYLNLTPYGRNIIGVGAAAHFYFGKTPEKLSLGESAMLAILPRAPTRYDPIRNPTAARAARDRLLDVLARRGVFSQEQIAQAKKQALPTELTKAPMLAPHLSQQIIHEKGAWRGEQMRYIKTTINTRTQRVTQGKVAQRIGRLRELGLENAAVVVLERKSRALRAMVGSAEFFNNARHGQINAAMIKRSPGSTLKPFLYALAFDAGEVVPASYLLDIPTDFSGYTARNYDNVYRGRVTVEQALTLSLNSPAVRLLSKVGLPNFYSILKKGGLQTLDKPYTHYGLPLVLGGCEARLLDLTSLYATLANGGLHRPVVYYQEDLELAQGLDAHAGVRILSAESCALTGEILSGLERPDVPRAWKLTRDAPAVAWKTGTSFGHRDAWAIGWSKEYVIGVWVGNLDGAPCKGISGAKHAGPLLLDVFRALEPGGASLPVPDMLNIDEIELCADSRDMPGALCPQTITAKYIPGVSKFKQDNMFKRIFVDTETGLRLEGRCLGRRPHKSLLVKEYPVELAAWMRSQGDTPPLTPALSPVCTDVPTGHGPRIVSPTARTPYLLRPEAPVRFQRIPLSAQAPMDSGTLFWYQNGKLVAQGPADEPVFLAPQPGRHRLVVMDEHGRMDALHYRVGAQSD